MKLKGVLTVVVSDILRRSVSGLSSRCSSVSETRIRVLCLGCRLTNRLSFGSSGGFEATWRLPFPPPLEFFPHLSR